MNIKKWKCKVCGEYQNKNERISRVFCSTFCFEKYKIRKCKFCGNEFKCDILSQRYCRSCSHSQEIENIKGKNRYHNVLINKDCKNCGKRMRTRKNVLLCKECKGVLPNPLVHKYNEITRNVLCPKCGEKIGVENVKKSYRTLENKTGKPPCPACKQEKKWRSEINRILRSRYLDENVINSIKEKFENAVGCKKEKLIEIIEIEKEKLRQKRRLRKNNDSKNTYIKESPEEKEKRLRIMSDRMKSHNPMKNRDVVDKVRKTFCEKIKKGEITYKRGREHWLWKGNRGFNLDCRNRLYKPWIFEVLKRDKFICTMCGSKKNLHVHHIRTLREIINIVLKRNEISAIKDIDTKSEIYERLILEVINEHKLNDGITVCLFCHDKIDNRYRRYKGEGKKNLQGKI